MVVENRKPDPLPVPGHDKLIAQPDPDSGELSLGRVTRTNVARLVAQPPEKRRPIGRFGALRTCLRSGFVA